ncbi:MAG: hypothetical protein ABIU54_11115 [Candidatus Eisenbacteria bacterium]
MKHAKAIMEQILNGFALEPGGHHGFKHWARVHENGMRLAESTGADVEVVRLFAMLHDSRRVDEFRDDGHGLRGAEFARSLRGSLIDLDDARFELLHQACALHVHPPWSADATLLTCWDADRLDLGRVGITPDPARLGTSAAQKLLEWAAARAWGHYIPAEVLEEWGIPIPGY